MPLENASVISQLDERYPLASDPGSRGDDHFRLIKNVLKLQFPGASGHGFSKPITVTEDFLNGLPQQLADMQANLDRRWPIGGCVILLNNFNPNGVYPGVWSLVTGDAALCLGDGSNNVGSTSGNNFPGVPLPQHNHGASFSGNALPPHSHSAPVFNRTYRMSIHDVTVNSYIDGNTNAVSAGTPSGSVSVDYAGTPNPTIDVRGTRIPVNLWRRVS